MRPTGKPYGAKLGKCPCLAEVELLVRLEDGSLVGYRLCLECCPSELRRELADGAEQTREVPPAALLPELPQSVRDPAAGIWLPTSLEDLFHGSPRVVEKAPPKPRRAKPRTAGRRAAGGDRTAEEASP